MDQKLFDEQSDPDEQHHPAGKTNPEQGYRVIARRYRPSRFEEVIGQEHVTRTLKNAIEEERLGHAYLFSGPRGIGKTSTARILARAINCEKGTSPEPCNKCNVCRKLEIGSTPDIIEIDAASQRGIDDIQSLRETVRYSPLQSSYRVYIIDEAHMLSRDAFNAFLKTLEEPPDHVIFVFATTEPEKMPETIRSRCQQFSFRRIPLQKMTNRLQEIAETEEIQMPTRILTEVCRAADGSLRDAQSLLDQLRAVADGEIQEEELKLVLGTVTSEVIHTLLTAISNGDAKTVLNTVHSVHHHGGQLDVFLEQLLSHLRDLLVIKTCGKNTDLVESGQEEREELMEQADRFNSPQMAEMVEEITRVQNRARNPFQSRLLLESTLVRLSHKKKRMTKAGNPSDEARESTTTSPASPSAQTNPDEDPGETTSSPSSNQQAETSRPRNKQPDQIRQSSSNETKTSDRSHQNERDSVPSSPDNIAKATCEHWDEILKRASNQSSTIAQLAENGTIAPDGENRNTVILRFKQEYAYNKEKLESENGTSFFADIIQNLFGSSPDIKFVVRNAPSEDEEEESCSDSDEVNKQTSPRQKARKDPNVQKAMEQFNADIVNIEE